MKKLHAIIIFLHSSVFAQQSIECQLMQQRISGKTSDSKLCLAIYQQCSVNAMQAPNTQAAQNLCSVGLGECQMGGALSGGDLQRVIEQYKKLCEK